VFTGTTIAPRRDTACEAMMNSGEFNDRMAIRSLLRNPNVSSTEAALATSVSSSRHVQRRSAVTIAFADPIRVG
jgi:hypothetical protein